MTSFCRRPTLLPIGPGDGRTLRVRAVPSATSSSMPARASIHFPSEKSPRTLDCSAWVAVRPKSGSLRIELVCRCGWMQSYPPESGLAGWLELDGASALLERFYQHHSKLRGPGMISGSLSCPSSK
jgi:hypothetical protein